mmetsp:Transcript_15394/g.23704  ORF Transcript_15394/g.23704 Transcript_15394/m.23704 type:complete len:319 (+) Transcript_15394:45-1001(+)
MMDLTSVARASMKHLIVNFLVLLESHLSVPMISVASLIRLVELEISTQKHLRTLRRLRIGSLQTLSIAELLLTMHQARVNSNVPMAPSIVRPALRVMNILRVLVVRHHRYRRLVSVTLFTVERIMPMQMGSALSRVQVVTRTNVLPVNRVFHSPLVTNKRQHQHPTTQYLQHSTAVWTKKMLKDPVITRVLEEQKIVRTACHAILSRLVLICLTMNQLPVFQTPNLRHLLLVRCIVEAALKMPHQTVWFPVQVVRQMSALQVKVVMDIPHVTIMTLSFAVQRGMKLLRPVQSRVLRVATTSVIMARYASDILHAVPPT